MSTPKKKITELGEQEVPLYADDLAVVVTDTGTTPTTKKTTLGTLRRFVLGIASVGTLVFPEQNQTLGTAVTGTDAASADVTVSVAPGTGAGGPAAYIVKVPVRVGGATDAQTLTEGFRVGEVANASGREVALWNPSGPVMGGIPTDAAAALFSNGAGSRTSSMHQVIALGKEADFRAMRINGTWDTPTAMAIGQTAFQLTGESLDDTGVRRVIALIRVQTRNDITTTQRGSTWFIEGTPLNEATRVTFQQIRAASATVGEIVYSLATQRFIPSSGGYAWRDSTNAADTMTLNAAGTAFALPLATAFVVGADPGGPETVRIGGTLSASNGIFRGINTSLLILSGSRSDGGFGGNIRLFGTAHATQANDIEFRSNGNVRGWWDDSAALWTFGGTLKYGDDATGTNVAATPALFRAPGSTGNANPTGYTWQMTTAGSSGTSVQSTYADRMTLVHESAGFARLTVIGKINASQEYLVAGTRVLSTRQAGVADATDSTDVVTQFNELLTRLRATGGHGLISD